MITEFEIQFRVRYQETDAQGRVHHANYLTWFEMGRVEMLRSAGVSYRNLEEQGVMLVIAEAGCRYYLAAVFDDLLTLRVKTVQAKGARIVHEYQVLRGEDLVAEGNTTVACVDRAGRVRRLPEWLMTKPASP